MTYIPPTLPLPDSRSDPCPLATAFVPPAFPYSKTAILLPQTASPRLRAAVGAALAHPLLRSTCTQSAEDAAVGPTDTSVVAVGWKSTAPDIASYFEEYYPHVSFSTLDALSPTEAAVILLPPLEGPIALSQRDPRWKDHYFGEDPTSTLGAYGCFVTACAILLRSVYQRDVLPCILDQLFVNDRHAFFAGNLLDWFGFCSLFTPFRQPVRTNVRYPADHLSDLLALGYEVILRRADGQHFVYLEAVASPSLRIIDPWTGERTTWQVSQYQGIRAVRVDPVAIPFPDGTSLTSTTRLGPGIADPPQSAVPGSPPDHEERA